MMNFVELLSAYCLHRDRPLNFNLTSSEECGYGLTERSYLPVPKKRFGLALDTGIFRPDQIDYMFLGQSSPKFDQGGRGKKRKKNHDYYYNSFRKNYHS